MDVIISISFWREASTLGLTTDKLSWPWVEFAITFESVGSSPCGSWLTTMLDSGAISQAEDECGWSDTEDRRKWSSVNMLELNGNILVALNAEETFSSSMLSQIIRSNHIL